VIRAYSRDCKSWIFVVFAFTSILQKSTSLLQARERFPRLMCIILIGVTPATESGKGASPSDHPPSSPPPLTMWWGSPIYGFHVFCLVVTYFEYYATMFLTPILLMGHPTASVPGSATCRPYALCRLWEGMEQR